VPENISYDDFMKMFQQKNEIFYPKYYDTRKLFEIFKGGVAKIADGSLDHRIQTLLKVEPEREKEQSCRKKLSKKLKNHTNKLKNIFFK
jgi:hypothetical protein